MRRRCGVVEFGQPRGGGCDFTPKQRCHRGGGGGAEAEEEDGGRDNNDFEGDCNNLGWGEEETTLTDGAMVPGGDVGADVGADNGSTEDEDEIGLIFDLEGKETKVCLRDLGSYVKFSKECRHKGYKSGSVKTYLSAQLFSAPTGKRRQVQNDVAKFEYSSMLKKISKAIQQGWEEKYIIHEEEIQCS